MRSYDLACNAWVIFSEVHPDGDRSLKIINLQRPTRGNRGGNRERIRREEKKPGRWYGENMENIWRESEENRERVSKIHLWRLFGRLIRWTPFSHYYLPVLSCPYSLPILSLFSPYAVYTLSLSLSLSLRVVLRKSWLNALVWSSLKCLGNLFENGSWWG